MKHMTRNMHHLYRRYCPVYVYGMQMSKEVWYYYFELSITVSVHGFV
jgi:hypothetical protein